jgi:hypothetical protein
MHPIQYMVKAVLYQSQAWLSVHFSFFHNNRSNMMRNLIKRNLNGSRILILFILSIAVYVLMLTVTIPEVMSYSGGMKLLDMMPAGYDHAYVNKLLSALGEMGRHAYLFHQIPVDMVYPFLFAVSNCLILAYFLHKMNKLDSLLFFFCFLPLLVGLFDYLENIGIITMLKTFPDNPPLLSQTTNAFSVLKSGFTTLYFIILIITVIAFGSSKLFREPQ